MLDFSSWLDLPLVWGLLIAVAVFMYVVLDGFDLGCGILFPFAPSNECRNKIMNSIAPFWDGNETWLILGGGGLFAVFPVAYSIIMPALYLPVIIMLLGLIFRGVAFEFRYKTEGRDRKLWDVTFHFGSLVAAIMQGIILGNFIQGFTVEGRNYAGGSLDWVNGFAITTGVLMVFGYALIGSTWLIMKTSGETNKWARNVANYVFIYVLIGMVIVCCAMPFIDKRVMHIWFDEPNMYFLSPIPFVTFGLFLLLWCDLQNHNDIRPFFTVIAIFLMAYLGFAISLYPWIVPFKFTVWQAAATSTSQSLLLVGALLLLPVILGYTFYSYYIFKGKADDRASY